MPNKLDRGEDAEAVKEAAQRLGRRGLLIWILVAAGFIAGVAGAVAYFGMSGRSDLGGAESDDRWMVSAALVLMGAMLAASLWKPRPPKDKAELLMYERTERNMLWVLPAQAALGLALAVYCAATSDFVLLVVMPPVFVTGHLLAAFLRAREDFSHQQAATALAAGLLTAVFCLSGLWLTSEFAPSWLSRLTALALTLPAMVAATAYALSSRLER